VTNKLPDWVSLTTISLGGQATYWYACFRCYVETAEHPTPEAAEAEVRVHLDFAHPEWDDNAQPITELEDAVARHRDIVKRPEFDAPVDIPQVEVTVEDERMYAGRVVFHSNETAEVGAAYFPDLEDFRQFVGEAVAVLRAADRMIAPEES
jgi:hypothetical protein